MRRSQRPQPLQPGRAAPDRWLLSYADFITLLFALFVVLSVETEHHRHSISQVAKAIHGGFNSLAANGTAAAVKPSTGQLSVSPQMAALAVQLRQALGGSIADGEIGLTQTQEGLVVSLREAGFFDSGEAQLLPGAAGKIERIGTLLRAQGLNLRVEGHSDDQPIHNAVFQSNWELSAARAMTVLLLLVDAVHYDPTRISMAGYGPYRPVADNATFAGRRLNRRVDLVVLPP